MQMTPSNPQYATYPSLRDRVVVISGGASGIGAAMVEAFVQNGSRVVFLDIDMEASETLAAHLAATYAHAPLFLPCDLMQTDQLQAAVETVTAQHSTIDVLVNNAANDARHSLEEVTPESWDRSIAVNLKHQFFLTQAVLPAMRAAGRGSIIHMSSIAWMIPSRHVPVYATAKAAIAGMAHTLAHEVGQHNIRVNCVLPGAILTERQRRLWLTPEYEAEIHRAQALPRLLQPEDVARLVLFLAADDSSGITGQNHIIDGGWV